MGLIIMGPPSQCAIPTIFSVWISRIFPAEGLECMIWKMRSRHYSLWKSGGLNGFSLPTWERREIWENILKIDKCVGFQAIGYRDI